LWWLGYCVMNQGIWLTWAVLAPEISVMIVAGGLGTLMTLYLILGVLRRLNFVRAPLASSDG
jgi:hydrogenase-4 membrane subunit HyfE